MSFQLMMRAEGALLEKWVRVKGLLRNFIAKVDMSAISIKDKREADDSTELIVNSVHNATSTVLRVTGVRVLYTH